jgi:hypothetical protein
MTCQQGPAGGTTTLVSLNVFNFTAATTLTTIAITDHIDVSLYQEVTLVVRVHALNVPMSATFNVLVRGNFFTLHEPVLAVDSSTLASVALSATTAPKVYLLTVPHATRLIQVLVQGVRVDTFCTATLSIDMVTKGGIGSLTGDGYVTAEGYRSFG